jgi:hypothetical protein
MVYKEWPVQGRMTHGYWVQEPAPEAGRKEGVTTCLSIVDKPLLKQYAANKAVDVFVDCWQEERKVWITAGSEVEFREVVKKAKYAHRDFTEQRADVGSAVHNWIENHVQGIELPITEPIRRGVESYLAWEKKYTPQFSFSERVIYSRKHQYAGRVDSGVFLDGMYGLVDFKTGKPDAEYVERARRYTGKYRARDEHFAQDGGYDIAISEEDGRKAEFYGVLYLDALEGNSWFFRTYNTEFYRDYYLAALTLHRLHKQAKKVNGYT